MWLPIAESVPGPDVASNPSVIPDSINGIDVSSVQGVIDWKKVKEAGFEFVYIQSSRYSSTKDVPYLRSLDGARDAGLRVGAYHFCSHDTDPKAQAEFFYRACNGLGSKPGELPPMVDWEYCTPSKYVDHPRHCVGWVEAFLAHATLLWYPDNDLRALRRLPVIYTYPFYAQGHQPALGRSTLSKYPLCYASYKSDAAGKIVPWLPGSEDGPIHALPEPFKRWVLWQYSGDRGELVPGVSAYCDRQVFSGSQGEWSDFLGLARPVHSSEFEVKE